MRVKRGSEIERAKCDFKIMFRPRINLLGGVGLAGWQFVLAAQTASRKNQRGQIAMQFQHDEFTNEVELLFQYFDLCGGFENQRYPMGIEDAAR